MYGQPILGKSAWMHEVGGELESRQAYSCCNIGHSERLEAQ